MWVVRFGRISVIGISLVPPAITQEFNSSPILQEFSQPNHRPVSITIICKSLFIYLKFMFSETVGPIGLKFDECIWRRGGQHSIKDFFDPTTIKNVEHMNLGTVGSILLKFYEGAWRRGNLKDLEEFF